MIYKTLNRTLTIE